MRIPQRYITAQPHPIKTQVLGYLLVFFVAEKIEVSSVLAVVFYGLYVNHSAKYNLTAGTQHIVHTGMRGRE